MDEVEYKMVIVVRKDLRLSPGKLAAQVAHAAVTCTLRAKEKKKNWMKKWMDGGQKKVVVKGEGIDHLKELMIQARDLGLPVALITDAGHTELPPGTVTCLGIGPGPENLIDAVTGELTLL